MRTEEFHHYHPPSFLKPRRSTIPTTEEISRSQGTLTEWERNADLGNTKYFYEQTLLMLEVGLVMAFHLYFNK